VFPTSPDTTLLDYTISLAANGQVFELDCVVGQCDACVYLCQYFMYKLRNTTIIGSESWLNASLYVENQLSYESYLAVAAMVPAVIFMFINVVISRWYVHSIAN